MSDLSGLPTNYDEPVRIAVIGGTGLSHLDGFTPVAAVTPQTPWGPPSAPVVVLKHQGVGVAFLARHGVHHQLAPHEVPARANIAALRALGVRTVVAFSAVGSLREEVAPMDFVLPDQLIDRTRGVRPTTFFEGGVVGHVGFADPFDPPLADVVERCAAALRESQGSEGAAAAGPPSLKIHRGGTVVCMEGPQFSTRAESRMYRAWGGTVINMSTLPEAKLAREAEMAYQVICMATDYDCWRSAEGGEDVSVEMVLGYMNTNSRNAKALVAAVLDELCHQHDGNLVMAKRYEGASQNAVKFMTKPEGRDPDAMKRVEYLFPGFWES